MHFKSDFTAHEWERRMPVLRRRNVAQRWLDASAQPTSTSELIRMARWLLHAEKQAPHEMLMRASSAVQLSDPTLSQQFADLAHRRNPSVATFVDLLDLHVEREEPHQARATLEYAQSLVMNEAERAQLDDAEIALCLFGDRDPAAAGHVVARIRSTDPAEARRIELRSLEALIDLLSARPDRASACVTDLVDNSAIGATVSLRCSVTHIATLLLAGRTGEVMTRSTALFEPAKRVSDMMPTAHPENAHYPEPPLAAAPTQSPVDWALMAGIVAHLRADHTEAVSKLHDAAVQQARGKGIFHAEACAWLIVAHCDAGRLQEAATQLNQFPALHLAVLPGLKAWAAGFSSRPRVTSRERATNCWPTPQRRMMSARTSWRLAIQWRWPNVVNTLPRSIGLMSSQNRWMLPSFNASAELQSHR